mmetsp:Transcript_26340/g.40577  ORF Transcript_26340/g.40577 Transcript_26340/m.40577 type:complete len:421 (-) Transcript_26340:629-1891(-)
MVARGVSASPLALRLRAALARSPDAQLPFPSLSLSLSPSRSSAAPHLLAPAVRPARPARLGAADVSSQSEERGSAAPRLESDGRLPEDGIEREKVDGGDGDREDHGREPNLEEVHEGDVVALDLGLGRHDDVGRRADEGAVAAEARAERQRPRQRLDVEPHHVGNHLLHDGDHGGGEGDVVDEGREDGRGPADQEDRERLAAAWRDAGDHAGEGVGDEAEEAELTHTLDDDEERGEEQQRVPLHRVQRLVAVVHVERHQQPHGPHDRDPGRVKMGDRVKEEGADDTRQHRAALHQQPAVRDGVHLLELRDVHDEGALDSVAEVPGQEVEHRWRRDDHTGAEVEEEVVEVEVLGEHVANDDVGRVADHGGRAADVGEDGLADEEGARVDVHELAQLARHGRDQQDRRHVVEERRQDRRHHA